MATAAVGVPPAQAEKGPSLYRLSVKQYLRMVETGVLTEKDKVELLEGRIVNKMPRNPPHDGTIACFNQSVGQLLPVEWVVRVQSAITTSDSVPEPDLAIVRGPRAMY